MFYHVKEKVKPNKIEYLIIIKENQICDISININNTRRYIISLSMLLTSHLKMANTLVPVGCPNSSPF